ncbi:MAG: STAS domain-containing protein [Nocardiopsaceae bacterium]|nr:STAS domain-containing protein [Nocardiopsaceae bacterium]
MTARLSRQVLMSDGSLHQYPTGHGPRTVVVTLPVQIDIANSGQVHDVLVGSLGGGAAVLIADGTGTTFCDCAGVSALTRAHHQAAATGAQLRVAACPAVLRILELTGADDLLDTYPTVAAALDGDQRPADGNDDGSGDSDRQPRRLPSPSSGPRGSYG